MFVKACECPEREPKTHSDICCGKEMRVLDVQTMGESVRPEATH
jgi:hypothetical protein